MKNIIRSSTGALVAGMIAAGCSTSPPAADVEAANTALSHAGQVIDHAAADPHVAKYASSELERARGALQKANEAWEKKHDVPATTHFAYLAQQRAATAQALANERVAHEALRVAAANRDRAVAAVTAERQAKEAAAAAAASAAPPAPAQQALPGFAFGAARLPAEAMPTIAQLAATLNNNPESKVMIEGHTDNVGSPDYNQTLAMERAQAVRTALVRHGVDVSRITVRSLGEDNPVASNDTRDGRRENRRAQVIIGDSEPQMVGSSQGSTAATASGSGRQGEQSGQHRQTPETGTGSPTGAAPAGSPRTQ
jgi:outer membrane protein OmpA-like peptidoglycan-associated protein